MIQSSVRLRDLAPQYDAILCDVWGVIRDGEALIEPAIEALTGFRAQGGRVCLVSNSPRRSASLHSFLRGMGAPDNAWDAAVTSGDATHALLSQFAPGPAFKLGPHWDDPIYEGTGLDFAPLEEARLISATGLVDYLNETPADYEALLTRGVERGLPLVCANPDIVVQGPGGRLLYCAGALAQRYDVLGGEVHYAGKPYPPIYERAYAALDGRGGSIPDKARILAIGDGVPTDLTGAAREGIDCLFISGGINEDGAALPAGLQPRWQAPALVW